MGAAIKDGGREGKEFHWKYCLFIDSNGDLFCFLGFSVKDFGGYFKAYRRNSKKFKETYKLFWILILAFGRYSRVVYKGDCGGGRGLVGRGMRKVR